MTVRTTETTVTFRHPFTLTSLDRPQPAGTYRLVTDEEEILSLSSLAFQRTATMGCVANLKWRRENGGGAASASGSEPLKLLGKG
jgi:hypothetical protein